MKIKSISKIKTGIEGFDEVLNGGIPKGRLILITGEAGAGKTVFLNEFLYRGIKNHKENGVFVTFEEKPEDNIKNMSSFGWNLDDLIKQKKLAIVDGSPQNIDELHSGEFDWVSTVVLRIKNAIKKTNAKRVSIDSLSTLLMRFSSSEKIRESIFLLADELKKLGVTILLSTEKLNKDSLSRFGVEEYISDGIIDLTNKPGQQKFLRFLRIIKLRGTSYSSGMMHYEITNDGLVVYPKIPHTTDVFKSSYHNKKKFGIETLDKLLGGGIPEGHIMLIAGNTGTGKTTLCAHFIKSGINNGENSVYVSLEEPPTQVKKESKQIGISLELYEKQNKLAFVQSGLIDISPDALLYEIKNTAQQINAKRIIVDSISSLISATMEKETVRQFLLQLTNLCKSEGITCILSYLEQSSFGAEKGQLLSGIQTSDMRLSSIVDGVIILRYIEREQSVDRLLNILKLRGSVHDKSIFRYEITKNGFVVGDKFKI